MKKIISILISFNLIISAKSQNSIKEIIIGDKCPDVELTNIINYKTTKARISDFKGKLLILDFWATFCVPCIGMFPKTDSLEKKFDHRVEFMPVTSERKEDVSFILDRIKKAKNISVTSATGDTILNALFRHTYIPHYVWINSEGKVIAITGLGEINIVNIQRALEGGTDFQLPVKIDAPEISVDIRKPVFVVSNPIKKENEIQLQKVEEKNLMYYSVLTKWGGIGSGGSRRDSFRIVATRNSIGGLYRTALGRAQYKYIFMNSTLWDVKDSSISHFNDELLLAMPTGPAGQSLKTNWFNENGFNYELQVPRLMEMRQKKFDIMAEDLNRYFGALYGINGKIEKRKVKCLVMIRTSNEEKLKTQGVVAERMGTQFGWSLKNVPLEVLINDLRRPLQMFPPLVDETAYTGNIDIELNCNLSKLDELNRELGRYGLQLIEAEREIDMIVIKSIQNQN